MLLVLNPYPPHYRTAFAFSLILYRSCHQELLRDPLLHPGTCSVYHVPHEYHTWVRPRLFAGGRPCLRQENSEPLNRPPTFWSSLSAPLACCGSRRLSAVRIRLAIPCLALAPNCLMLAVATSPHGSATTLSGTATLFQALLIQPGRALEAELQVRSSFRESLQLLM
jgi:hypothetical protein